MNPKVSVIIPCYNYQKYIEQCLMSVLLQKRDFNIEIIVSDDNSSDNSFEIVKRIRHYYEDDNTKFILLKSPLKKLTTFIADLDLTSTNEVLEKNPT